MGKILDRAKMLRDINRLVDNDWAFDIDCHSLPNSKPFTQKEAKEMASVIARVHMISHCITCTSCQRKYLTPKDEVTK